MSINKFLVEDIYINILKIIFQSYIIYNDKAYASVKRHGKHIRTLIKYEITVSFIYLFIFIYLKTNKISATEYICMS
jgi:hypothetical protein